MIFLKYLSFMPILLINFSTHNFFEICKIIAVEVKLTFTPISCVI